MSVLSNSPVVIFGANGQLGTELQRLARKHGRPLRSFSHGSADIADARAVDVALNGVDPVVVINAAAYTKVDDAETDREGAIRSNVIGAAVLANACASRGAALIHISSDYVFDGTKSGAYVESDPVAPLGFYGKTKAEGEAAIRRVTARHVILRASWLYGEFGNNFLKTMLRLAGQRDEISVVADQYGCPTSTRDLASAVLKVAEQIDTGRDVFGTYHFAGSGITTWHGFASAALGRFCKLTGRKVRVRAITTAEYPTRTRRPANSAFDCSKFESVFGFRGRPWREEVEEITEILIRQQGAAQTRIGEIDA